MWFSHSNQNCRKLLARVNLLVNHSKSFCYNESWTNWRKIWGKDTYFFPLRKSQTFGNNRFEINHKIDFDQVSSHWLTWSFIKTRVKNHIIRENALWRYFEVKSMLCWWLRNNYSFGKRSIQVFGLSFIVTCETKNAKIFV